MRRAVHYDSSALSVTIISSKTLENLVYRMSNMKLVIGHWRGLDHMCLTDVWCIRSGTACETD